MRRSRPRRRLVRQFSGLRGFRWRDHGGVPPPATNGLLNFDTAMLVAPMTGGVSQEKSRCPVNQSLVISGSELSRDWSGGQSYATIKVMIKSRLKALSASEFKARCLKILDELNPQGILITKRGRPVAKLTPLTTIDNAKLIGSMKGRVIVKGNIFSTGVKWIAES